MKQNCIFNPRYPLWIWAIFFGMVLLVGIAPVAGQQATDILTDAASGVQYRVERLTAANFPVGMAFTPDGRLFYTEKINGRVRVINADGTLQREPVISFNVNALQERGMLGLAVDPNFEENRYLYVVYTRAGTARDWPTNVLVRFRELDGRGFDPEDLFAVPITTGELLHNGGNVHFDDEGYLFLSLGDYGEPAYAQDLTTPQGAIHRFTVTDEGLIPAAGNPFGDDNSIWAYGLRNPFDFTFDPLTGRMFSVDVGPSCDDEINIIYPSFNYGWRENYECVGREMIIGLRAYLPPLLSYTPVEAPTGIMFYDHEAIPEWQGDLFLCNWIFGTLRRVVMDEARTRVVSVHDIDLGDVQCRLDLITGPNGAMFFGTVDETGGAIYRLVPVQGS